MKKFEVLETHLGDKLYKPGDPETGTRMAEPDEVRHLVELGVLKPMDGADGDATQAGVNVKAEDAKTIADLREQVAALTTQRDDARKDAAGLADRLTAFGKTEADLREQVAALTTQRDDARKDAAGAADKVTDVEKAEDEGAQTPLRRGRGNQ